jgi:hypothetical protein
MNHARCESGPRERTKLLWSNPACSAALTRGHVDLFAEAA